MSVPQIGVSVSLVRRTSVRIEPIAWVVAFALLFVAPGALPYGICFIVAEIAILALLASAIRRRKPLATVDRIVAAWFASMIAGTAWSYAMGWGPRSPYPDTVFNGGEMGPLRAMGESLIACAAFFVIRWSLDNDSGATKSSVSLPIFCLLIASAGVSVLGLIEEVRNLVAGTTDPRLQATFTNPNLFGAFLCLVVPIALAEALRRGASKSTRISCALLATTLAILAVLTQSRGTILGCAVGIAYLCIALWTNQSKNEADHSRRVQFALRALGGIAATIVVIGIVLFPRLLHQSRTVSDDQRKTCWRAAAMLIKAHPIVGYGVGSFPAAGASLHLKELNPDTPTGLPMIPSMHLHAHDLLLQTWVERGLLGALLTVALVVWIFSAAWRLISTPQSATDAYVSIGAISALIACLIQNVSDYTLWYAPVGILFWFVLAMAVNSMKPVTKKG